MGFGLVYCVGVNEQENPMSRMNMFQYLLFYAHKKYLWCLCKKYGCKSMATFGCMSMPFDTFAYCTHVSLRVNIAAGRLQQHAHYN